MIRSMALLLLCLALSWGEENANAARCDEIEAETQALKAEKDEMEKSLVKKDEKIRALEETQSNAKYLELRIMELRGLLEKERHFTDHLLGQLSIYINEHFTLQNEVTDLRSFLEVCDADNKNLTELTHSLQSQVEDLTNDNHIMKDMISFLQFDAHNVLSAQ